MAYHKSRAVSAIVALAVLAACRLSHGQTVVVVKSSSLSTYDRPIEGFQEALGGTRIIVFDMKGAELTKTSRIAQQIRKIKPDLIFTLGWRASAAAVRHFADIPVVFAMVLNWRKYQLKTDNSTGISLDVPVETQLTQFKLVVPRVSRVGVVYNPQASAELVKLATVRASRLGVKFVAAKISSSQDLPGAFDDIADDIDSIWMVPDPVAITLDNYRFLVKRCRERKLPFLAYSENFVRAGALMSVSPDYHAIGAQAGLLVRQILEDGVKAGKIPVAPPIGTQLVLNLKVAKLLDLKIDSVVYQSVDKLLEEDGSQQ